MQYKNYRINNQLAAKVAESAKRNKRSITKELEALLEEALKK